MNEVTRRVGVVCPAVVPTILAKNIYAHRLTPRACVRYVTEIEGGLCAVSDRLKFRLKQGSKVKLSGHNEVGVTAGLFQKELTYKPQPMGLPKGVPYTLCFRMHLVIVLDPKGVRCVPDFSHYLSINSISVYNAIIALLIVIMMGGKSTTRSRRSRNQQTPQLSRTKK